MKFLTVCSEHRIVENTVVAINGRDKSLLKSRLKTVVFPSAPVCRASVSKYNDLNREVCSLLESGDLDDSDMDSV